MNEDNITIALKLAIKAREESKGEFSKYMDKEIQKPQYKALRAWVNSLFEEEIDKSFAKKGALI
jgi:hypothetical protein